MRRPRRFLCPVCYQPTPLDNATGLLAPHLGGCQGETLPVDAVFELAGATLGLFYRYAVVIDLHAVRRSFTLAYFRNLGPATHRAQLLRDSQAAFTISRRTIRAARNVGGPHQPYPLAIRTRDGADRW